MSLTIVQVDAFTAEPFAGNPAAVCVLARPATEGWMRNVAREMNLSETAFLVLRDDGSYDLRWFTPEVEVSLCGHATLASAHVLWTTGRLAVDEPARFQTKSGLLSARRDGEWIEMNFPAKPPQAAETPAGLDDALGARPVAVLRNDLDYLVELNSEAEVRKLSPNIALLSRVEARGVIVTARASKEFDFVSRFFAPCAGVDEDPVTGSAHCCLAPYWAERLGKRDMIGYQASQRGGVVRVGHRGERVLLAGQAVTVVTATLEDVAAARQYSGSAAIN